MACGWARLASRGDGSLLLTQEFLDGHLDSDIPAGRDQPSNRLSDGTPGLCDNPRRCRGPGLLELQPLLADFFLLPIQHFAGEVNNLIFKLRVRGRWLWLRRLVRLADPEENILSLQGFSHRFEKAQRVMHVFRAEPH